MKHQVEEININRNVKSIKNSTFIDPPKAGQTNDLNKNLTTVTLNERIGCGNGTGIFRILVIPDFDSDEFVNDDQQQRSLGSFFNNVIMDDFAPELGLF